MENPKLEPGAARYSRVAMAIHWATAIAIVFELGLGLAMTGPRTAGTFASYQLHKSIGLVILTLSVARLAWRLFNAPPALPADIGPVERLTARLVHTGFYVLIIALPLTGWLLVSTSKVSVPTRLFDLVGWPVFPGVSLLAAGGKLQVHDASELAHEVLAYGAILLLLLHIAGALKHQLSHENTYLSRMLPGRPERSTMLASIALLTCIAFAAIGYVFPGSLASGHANQQTTSIVTATQAGQAQPRPDEPKAESIPNDGGATPVATELATASGSAVSSDWSVDRRSSSIGFNVSWDNQALSGRFTKWDARIHFDPNALSEASADVTISVASVTTSSSEVNDALPGPDWFAVATHPQARFVSHRFRRISDKSFEATGDLTIRGITRTIKLPFTLTISGDTAKMSGATSIDRSAFGVGQNEWASTDSVAASVRINVVLVASRKPH